MIRRTKDEKATKKKGRWAKNSIMDILCSLKKGYHVFKKKMGDGGNSWDGGELDKRKLVNPQTLRGTRSLVQTSNNLSKLLVVICMSIYH